MRRLVVCANGPVAGRAYTIRREKGLILVDRPNQRVWIYDFDPATITLECRDTLGELLNEDPLEEKNRFRAAAEGNYEVVAAPWVGDADDNSSA